MDRMQWFDLLYVLLGAVAGFFGRRAPRRPE